MRSFRLNTECPIRDGRRVSYGVCAGCEHIIHVDREKFIHDCGYDISKQKENSLKDGGKEDV